MASPQAVAPPPPRGKSTYNEAFIITYTMVYFCFCFPPSLPLALGGDDELMMAHLSSFVSLDKRPHAHLQPLFFRFHPPLFFCLVHPFNNSLCARFPTIEYALAEAEISKFFVFPTSLLLPALVFFFSFNLTSLYHLTLPHFSSARSIPGVFLHFASIICFFCPASILRSLNITPQSG